MKIYQFKGKCNISGSAIRRERERQRLSQEQLAARMQVEGIQLNQKAISRIETGGRVVADYELTTFSRVLGVSMQRLVDTEGERIRFLRPHAERRRSHRESAASAFPRRGAARDQPRGKRGRRTPAFPFGRAFFRSQVSEVFQCFVDDRLG